MVFRCAIANGMHFPSIIKRTIGIVAGVVSAGEYIGEVFFYGYLILSGRLGEYFYADGGITSHLPDRSKFTEGRKTEMYKIASVKQADGVNTLSLFLCVRSPDAVYYELRIAIGRCYRRVRV